MSELHPDDEQLLLHAEGGGDQTVAAHVAGCRECSDAVEAANAGRHALRSAPLLELPAERREAVLAGLPERERARRPGRRFLGVAIPLVALASVVAVVGLTGGTDPERTAEQMAAEDAALDSDAAQDAPAALEAAPAEERATAGEAAVLRLVAGPPEEVARLLRAEGLSARVVDGAVEVTDAAAADVEDALRDRPDGEVEIRLR